MPTGPEGQRRPADVIGNAIKVARLATGEEDEKVLYLDASKDPAAQEIGRKSGKTRAEGMTPERRAEIAKKTAKRWAE